MASDSTRASGSYEAGLERTVQELNRLKMQLEDALQQLRSSADLSGVRFSAKDSSVIMERAYRELTETEPLLPPSGSVLPALLAMRRAKQTIADTNEFTESQTASLEQIKRKTEEEQANLLDQQALEAALQNRLNSLCEGLENSQEKTDAQIALERIAELRQQKDNWDKQTASLMKQLDWFIGEHLGGMLAAEELGGPVVGELMDIDRNDLSAGFSSHGKLKRAKEQPDQDKRQRRIDDIWGPMDQQGQPSSRKRDRDEASAASNEMRDLIEQLMNKLMEAGGDNSAAYVEIPRESAAARFLVRSKVAVFHPKDARKLRLIDFGRALDD